MCFIDLKLLIWFKEKLWSENKKKIPEMMVKVVMSLCKATTIKIKVGSGYSEKFSVKVGVDQGSVLSPFSFAPVIDVIT